ncbi:aminotransferase class I/II-fold pyridoxal phosphate-dependent enzyme [Candidatus Pacearchaeota archaeon]|nr:aminotransferase class I/II-fold pyridoxal phosphate-dependent enzyme [Candidatus Pacearchaeota archaeon]
MDIETIAVHGGQHPDEKGAIAPPIYASKNYSFLELEKSTGYEYSRSGNPTRTVLENLINELEDGFGCLTFSSGLAAIECLFQTLDKGSHVILSDKLYGGTFRLANKVLSKYLEIETANFNNIKEIKSKIKSNTKYLFLETPTNPLLEIIDLNEIKKISEESGVPFIVDNTFATPYLLKPFEYSAETIVHSISKFLSGHDDVLAGAIVTKNIKLLEDLKLYSKTIGSVLSPFDAYLAIRGIKTLTLRMEKHCENAGKIAEFLSGNEKVKKVFYPGLKSHAGYEVARQQMKGFGGVVCFEIDSDREGVKRFADYFASNPDVIYLAESLGGVESLIAHPATMSHSSLTEEQREKAGISYNLFRLSCGIENSSDIVECLENALRKI